MILMQKVARLSPIMIHVKRLLDLIFSLFRFSIRSVIVNSVEGGESSVWSDSYFEIAQESRVNFDLPLS